MLLLYNSAQIERRKKISFWQCHFFSSRTKGDGLSALSLASRIDRLKFLDFIYMMMNGRFFGFNIEKDGRGGINTCMIRKA